MSSGANATTATRPGVDPVAELRVALGRGVRRLITGNRAPVRDLSRSVVGDPGLFGPDSVTWRVHADSAMLVGGIRSLLLQTMHPLAMAGVAQHSLYRSDPGGRLARTASFVGITTYGTVADAEQAIAKVRSVHRRVKGTAPDGRPYEANDPHLLAWVHHTLVDSFLRAYRRYGGEPLSDDDADRYVDEQARLALLIGATEPLPARSVAELRAWMLAIRPELRADRDAREATRFLLLAPLPIAVQPVYGVLAAAAVGLLPGFVRRDLWLPAVPLADPVVVRPAARLIVRTLDWALKAPGAATDQ